MYPVRRQLSSLSGPQRDALGAALGLTSGKAPSRFPVAAGVVELLVTLAEEQAVLCLVRRCAMDRPAVSRGAHLRAATDAPCCSMRRMRGGRAVRWEGPTTSEGGASIGLLRERAGPGRPLHGGLEAWTGSEVQHGRGPLRGKIKNPSRALEEDLVSL